MAGCQAWPQTRWRVAIDPVTDDIRGAEFTNERVAAGITSLIAASEQSSRVTAPGGEGYS
jgi:hypothetical protein